MIAVRIEGRLGNQLFQYAFIYSAAKKLNTSFYCDKGIEKFKLYDYFEIEKDFFYPIDKYVFTIEGFKNVFRYHLRRMFYGIVYKIVLKKEPISVTNDECVSVARIRIENNRLYYGFFQSEGYFKEFKEHIKVLFKVKESFKKKFNTIYSQFDTNKSIVVIHVRRTDYVGMGIAVDLSYYHNAIKLVKEKNSFFVFVSDDVKFVETEFEYLPQKYISRNSEIIDFQFLMNADICILSNSSFSWWGAYLNEKASKVIVPKYWLGREKEEEFPKNVIVDKWIQL